MITTLRSQLTRAFMLTAVLALALNACLILAYEFNRYRIEAADELHTQEIILAKALMPSLVFNDPEAASQQLASLAERHDVIEAEVFGANGRPFARYRARAQQDSPAPTQNPPPLSAVDFRVMTSNSPTTYFMMANASARCTCALTRKS